MREKVVLIGAGSAMFTRGLVADMINKGWETDLALVDIDAEALGVAEGLARKMVEARGAPIRLSAAQDRCDVLKGATVVVCTVGVGGRRAWERDVFIPREYGIYQPVGDSVMPGGTSRALRMIPPMVQIAEDVLDLCPKALFFNYGNPMAPICRAIRKVTGANVVGLCHGVHNVGQYLAGVLGVEEGQFKYTAVGMNHLTWFVEVRVRGEDAMGRLREIAAERCGAKGAGDNPFSWRLMHLFGAFPAVLDRHVIEFFPWMFAGEGQYYGKTLGVEVFSVEDIIARGDQIFDRMRRDAASGEPLGEDFFASIGGEHEQVIDIIESIRSDTGEIYSANLPNTGQVPNLPGDSIVEAPAAADGTGLRAIAQPPLPPQVAGTLATRLQWVETIVEAAIEGSREKFIQALVLDSSVESIETACRLADDLLRAQAEYLPQFKPR